MEYFYEMLIIALVTIMSGVTIVRGKLDGYDVKMALIGLIIALCIMVHNQALPEFVYIVVVIIMVIMYYMGENQ